MARISRRGVVVVGPRILLVRGRLVGMTMNILEIGGMVVGILVLVRGSVDERCEILQYVLLAPSRIVSWSSSFSLGRCSRRRVLL